MKNFIYIAMAIAAPITLVNCTKEKTIVEVQKGNSFHTGTQTPTAAVGNVGDFYLNTATSELYGPKTAEGWGTPKSMSGAKMIAGSGAPAADKGAEGDWYLDTVAKRLYGPKTSTGWGVRYVSLDPQDPALAPDVITAADYELSPDGKTLVKWKNVQTKSLDMQEDAVLKNVTAIGDYAFEDMKLRTLVLPNELKTIGRRAFEDNDLIIVNIPNKVTHIGVKAFSGNELTSVTIPNSVVSLEEGAFMYNHIRTVVIPTSITMIAKEVFRNNELAEINIPNNITIIDEEAFFENKIVSLSLPSSVKKVEERAFCVNRLKTVVIPEGVTKLGTQAFSSNRLKTVNLPSTLSGMGALVFSNNSYLESATFAGTTPPLPIDYAADFDTVFKDTQISHIYVPASSVAAYKALFPTYQSYITAK